MDEKKFSTYSIVNDERVYMINETFVASDPKGAYEQAVQKYGNDVSLVSAKQLKYDDGVLRCEVVIAVPTELFMEKSFGDMSMDNSSSDEDETLLEEIGELKAQLEVMKEGIFSDIRENDSVISEVKGLFMKKGISEKWLDEILNSLIGTSLVEDKELLASYLIEEIDAALKVKEDVAGKVQAMKDSSVSGSKLKQAEQQAAVINSLVDEYEATFVPVGRTLAEIINQPAKIFTKMIWLHNMMEITEGPVSQSMKDVYAKLNQQRDAANLEYDKNIEAALSEFEGL